MSTGAGEPWAARTWALGATLRLGQQCHPLETWGHLSFPVWVISCHHVMFWGSIIPRLRKEMGEGRAGGRGLTQRNLGKMNTFLPCPAPICWGPMSPSPTQNPLQVQIVLWAEASTPFSQLPWGELGAGQWCLNGDAGVGCRVALGLGASPSRCPPASQAPNRWPWSKAGGWVVLRQPPCPCFPP